MQDLLISENSAWTNRVRYVKRSTKDSSADVNGNSRSRKSQIPVLTDGDRLSAESDLLFLKHAVIKNQNPELVIEKLSSTRALRDEKCAEIDKDYREHFPFFFTNPELVSMQLDSY